MKRANEQQIRKHYQLLRHEDYGVTELRTFGKGPPMVAYCDNENDFLRLASQMSGEVDGVYVGVNPRPLDFFDHTPNRWVRARRGDNCAEDKDIEFITTLFFDADPERPKGSPSTREELQRAIQSVKALRNANSPFNCGCVLATSGNGAYILQPIRAIEVTPEMPKQLKAYQTMMHTSLNGAASGVKYDNVYNPSRVMRVIGTLNMKGKVTRGRPHRLAQFISDLPDEPSEIVAEQIEATEVQDKPLVELPDVETNVPSDFDKLQACAFFEHCTTNAKKLDEPDWRNMIFNLMWCKGGDERIHLISALDASRYDQEDTQARIERYRQAKYRPTRCENLDFKCPKLADGNCPASTPMNLIVKHNQKIKSRRLGTNPDFRLPPAVSVEDARATLRKEVAHVQSTPVGKIHVFRDMAGTGKTTIAAHTAARKRVTWLGIRHDTLSETLGKIKANGGMSAKKLPQITQDKCPEYYGIVNFFMANNYDYREIICKHKCPKMKSCEYLSAFHVTEEHQQLLATTDYQTHDDFWGRYANNSREITVYDEDPISYLLEQRNMMLRDLRNYKEQMENVVDSLSRGETGTLARTHIDFCQWAIEMIEKYSESEGYIDLPNLQPGTPDQESQLSFTMHRWLRDSKEPYKAALNLTGDINHLLKAEPPPIVYAHGETISYHKCHPIPEDKTGIILDSTANVKMLEAATGREAVDHGQTRIKNNSQLIQIMDHNFTKNYLKRDMHIGGNYTTDPPNHIIKIVNAILEKHSDIHDVQLISFGSQAKLESDIVEIIRARCKYPERITTANFYGSRGSNEYQKPLTIIIGSPKMNETDRRLLAMAIYNEKIDTSVELKPITREVHGRDIWLAECFGYDDPKLQAIYEMTTTAELTQAIGRSRYTTEDRIVYIVTNEPLDIPEIERYLSGEILGSYMKRRPEYEDRYKGYEETALEPEGGFNNSVLCQIIGLKQPNGIRYWKRFFEKFGSKLTKKGTLYYWQSV